MHRSIGYLFLLLITLVSLKTVQTESVDLSNQQSKLKEWLIERRRSTSTTTDYDESETSSSSFGFCTPFHTCSTGFNRTLLVIVVSIFLLIFCFYYHCQEYCAVKRALEQGTYENCQQYHCTDGSVHNKAFHI